MEPETLSPEQADAAWDELAAEREAGTPPSDTAPAPDPATPAATAAPAATPAPSAAPVPAPAEDPTITALRGEIRGLTEGFQRLQSDHKAAVGRVSALQRELDTAKTVAGKAGGESPSQAQIAAASKSPEKWEQMKQDFPEWGEAIELMVNHRLGSMQAPAPLDMGEIDKRVQEAVAAERRSRVEEYVEDRHPGWKQTVNSNEWGDWFKLQKPEVQMLAGSPNSRDAVRLLDLYAEHKKAPAAEVTTTRKQVLAAAATTKPGTTPPRKSEDEMTPDELWDHLARKRDPSTGRFAS